jgi:hypothetical protein
MSSHNSNSKAAVTDTPTFVVSQREFITDQKNKLSIMNELKTRLVDVTVKNSVMDKELHTLKTIATELKTKNNILEKEVEVSRKTNSKAVNLELMKGDEFINDLDALVQMKLKELEPAIRKRTEDISKLFSSLKK